MPYTHDVVLQLLSDARMAGATDIHLKAPGRPSLRVDGRLVATPYEPLAPQDTIAVVQVLLNMARVELALARVHDEQFAFGVPELGRFRAHLYRQRGSLAVVVHRMALQPPTLKELGAPNLGEVVWDGDGLVLLTGRQHRVRLAAALVEDFNLRVPGHVMTLEDPMEYLHRDGRARISQREIGVDTPTLEDGLTAAGRTDPDALVVHDIASATGAELALRLAERGLCVVAGLAGCRFADARGWFVRLFPPSRHDEIAGRLGAALRAVVGDDGDGVHVVEEGPAIVVHNGAHAANGAALP